MAIDLTALLAEVQRDTSVTDSLITFLEGFPPQTTIDEVVASIKANSDRVENAMIANVPPPA